MASKETNLSNAPLHHPRTDEESGRSMIEMLGVLAIVGVLSIGALAGYSQAMTTHKINLAVEEINTIVTDIRDLYTDKSNYLGIDNTLLAKAGILRLDFKNVFNNNIRILDSNNHFLDQSFFKFEYSISNEKQCQKLLLAKLEQELIPAPGYFYTWNPETGAYFFKWDDSGHYQLPPRINDVLVACKGTTAIGFYSK
ncbi:MAG: hypothetical protein GY804_06475 [Alphaproteobacteria bacterium]|nr:hypothetical protein [Alphaproteobacteria bacterium]